MQHIIFTANKTYETAILVKDTALIKAELETHYLDKITLPPASVIAFNLKYEDKKATVKLIKHHMQNVLKACNSLGIKTLFVCDGPYFKVLAGQRKAEAHYGYVFDCVIKGFEHMKVILGANYQALYYNPESTTDKIALSLKTLQEHTSGLHIEPGVGIIHSAYYPDTVNEISVALDSLMQHDALTIDLETFSLSFDDAGIGTIAFAWDQHNGIAFTCDWHKQTGNDALRITDHGIRGLLKAFLVNYQGKLIYHNANYDIKILIYELFMEGQHFNQTGMIEGLELLTKNFDDTKIISYLATNSTARNSLGLKDLAQSFAGNYAESEIKDIKKMDEAVLLQYNLVDCLSTWFVHNKYDQQMRNDDQLSTYETIMRPSVKVILQMELTGMPMLPRNILKADLKLGSILEAKHQVLGYHPLIKDFNRVLQKEEWTKKNLLLKVKVRPLSDFDDVSYNPGSNQQTSKLLHNFLGLPIMGLTPKKEPSVGNKTLAKIKTATSNPAHLEILTALMEIGEVSIILNTFVKAFQEKGIIKEDGRTYLHGNFNIGGTVSGRLSSSGPNMQNIPSTGTVYAKDIKKCFQAPSGWLMAGADFSSLEDRISALTTKDPNKLKVYIDGFDGHCLRAHTYFGDQMSGINPDSVSSINSIAKKYPELRQNSKAPTFLLTYGGTHHGLIANVGLDKIAAKQIEDQYHVLYKVSDDWVKDKLQQATTQGYITVAFGLRVRTPILAKTILGRKSTPYEAQSEGRTAGNALGQSYGLLNNRAGIEFQDRTLNSRFKLDIKPIAQIHDSLYFLVRDTYECVKWFNDNLIECMEWQDLPELQHPIVKLGGAVEIYHPTWADTLSLNNNLSFTEIRDAIRTQTP